MKITPFAFALLLVPASLVACGADDRASTGSESDITKGESALPGEKNSICGGIGGLQCKAGLVCEGTAAYPDAAGKCAAPQPPDGGFCTDGTVESEPSYLASTDGKECRLNRVHCLTKNAKACPMPSPYPPDFCTDGTVESEPSYLASTDGKECRLNRVHCLTKNAKACPMPSPYPPDFCTDGTIESEPSYLASTDGKECRLDRIHCLTKNAKACPMP